MEFCLLSSNFLVFNLKLIIMFNNDNFYGKSMIVDMGTANTKFGWSGDDQPKSVIKSILG